MFSKTTEYAFRASVFLCEAQGRRVPAQEIAAATHVPVRYMSKVLQTLTEAGLIESQRGPSGGFWLTRDPADLSLLDIVQAIDPLERITECPLGLKEHCETLCPLHRELDNLAQVAIEQLRNTPLKSLMQQKVVPLGMKVTVGAGASNGHANGNGHH
ncbi:MAG: Rrf2 family transcriptional regulator [Planctomycetota bacterium]